METRRLTILIEQNICYSYNLHMLYIPCVDYIVITIHSWTNVGLVKMYRVNKLFGDTIAVGTNLAY